MNCDEVISRALELATPSSSEKKRIDEVITLSKQMLCKKINELGINAEVLLGGSAAKKTWLKGQHDIDFFVVFEGYTEEQMMELFENFVPLVFEKVKTLHGSRNYFKAELQNHEIEIIPVMKIPTPSFAKNSMDASPFHAEYICKKISESPELAEQVKIFKLFAKSCGVYGAETYVSGLSGYATELLMIHFRTFKNFVEKSDNLKPPVFIDLQKHYVSETSARKKISKPKLKSPLIVIDPLLRTRNATAAVSDEAFSKLLFNLRMFARYPNLKFFKEQDSLKKTEQLSKKRGTLLITRFIKTSNEGDSFFSKLAKKIEQGRRQIEKEGISVYSCGLHRKKGSVAIHFEIETLKTSKKKKTLRSPRLG